MDNTQNTVSKEVINTDGSTALQITVQPPAVSPAPQVMVLTLDELNQALINAQADLAATQAQQPNDLAAFVASQASVIATKEANIADIQDSLNTLQAATQ